MLVNCFLIGAAKSGTTSLSYWMGQHRDIYIPAVKETHFFTDESYYAKGVDYWLSTDYPDTGSASIIMDCTPAYFHRPDLVIPRLKPLVTDDCRFIVVLRNPVRRAYSHYLHQKKNGKEVRTFDHAITEELKKGTDVIDCNDWLCYLQDGMYGAILSKWFRHFDREQFKLVIFEEMVRNPYAEVSGIFEWLGVASMKETELDFLVKNKASEARSGLLMKMVSGSNPIKHLLRKSLPYRIQRRIYRLAVSRLSAPASKRKSAPPPGTHVMLAEHYRDDISLLRNITGETFEAWDI